MIRATLSGGRLAALGVSAAVHAAVLLSPMGHASASRQTGEVAALELSIDPLTPVESPEAPSLPAAGRSPTWPTHTHPYPVPLDHDATPHDPHLEHHHAAEAAKSAPALAAPAQTASDDTPHFFIAIGGASSASGIEPSTGAASEHANPEIDATPFAESAVDGKARLVRGVSPAYPAGARASGVEGDVQLEIVVSPAGSVESARVVRGVGGGLDEAALAAVRQFRFAAATKAGAAVRVRMGWVVQFRLN